MNSEAPPSAPSAEPAPAMQIAALRLADPLRWLAAGWRDLLAAKGIALFYGICFWLMAVVLGAVFRNSPEYATSFLSGCFLVGPFLAMGLYEVSRRREQGLPQDLGASLTCWDSHLGSMGMLVLVMLLLELLWGRASLVVFAVFFNTGMPSTAGVVRAIFNPANWQFIAVYLAGGRRLRGPGVFDLRGVDPDDPGPRHRRHLRRHRQHPGGGRATPASCCCGAS